MALQAPKRHHHFLPQLYLKGFIEPGSRWFVWVYERGRTYDPGKIEQRHNPWRAAVKAAGAQRDLYADPKPDGTVDYDTYENILERLESPATPVFHKVRIQKRILASEKALLASYIGVMLKRVPAREKRTSEIWPELVRRTDWVSLEEWAKQKGYANAREVVARVRHEFEQGMPREIALKSMVMPYDRVLDALGTMSWKFFVAPTGSGFATSDNPVFFPESLGMGADKAVLVFPISSEIALVASWFGARDLSYVHATKTRVNQVNAHVLQNASKFGYFWSANLSIQTLLNAPRA